MKRRDFIAIVAASGGSAYAAMHALKLLGKPAKAQTQFLQADNTFDYRVEGEKSELSFSGQVLPE